MFHIIALSQSHLQEGSLGENLALDLNCWEMDEQLQLTYGVSNAILQTGWLQRTTPNLLMLLGCTLRGFWGCKMFCWDRNVSF